MIVSMRTKIGQLKGKLTLMKNMEQAGTEKTRGGTNKQRQKRDETWNKVPTKSDKPTTKKIGKKDFHWCKYHMEWTVYHPKDCKLKDATAKLGDAASPPTGFYPV